MFLHMAVLLDAIIKALSIYLKITNIRSVIYRSGYHNLRTTLKKRKKYWIVESDITK